MAWVTTIANAITRTTHLSSDTERRLHRNVCKTSCIVREGGARRDGLCRAKHIRSRLDHPHTLPYAPDRRSAPSDVTIHRLTSRNDERRVLRKSSGSHRSSPDHFLLRAMLAMGLPFARFFSRLPSSPGFRSDLRRRNRLTARPRLIVATDSASGPTPSIGLFEKTGQEQCGRQPTVTDLAMAFRASWNSWARRWSTPTSTWKSCGVSASFLSSGSSVTDC